MSSKKVTLDTHIVELNLPHLPPDNLVCTHYKPSIIKALEKVVDQNR